jgi:hypothetical protein
LISLFIEIRLEKSWCKLHWGISAKTPIRKMGKCLFA